MNTIAKKQKQTKVFHVGFFNRGNNLLVVLTTNPLNKKNQPHKFWRDVWKNHGPRPDVNKQSMIKRKRELLKDTNETYKTNFKSVTIEVVEKD